MAGAAFITVNDSGVVTRFHEMGARLEDLQPVAEAWALVMLRSAQKTFEAGGRPSGWPELAPSTIARRRGKSGYQILRDQGLLMMSLHPTITPSNEYSVREIGNGIAYVGTTRPGAENHQKGLTLPQRIFLLHQPEDIEDFRTILLGHVVHGEIEDAN